MIEALGNWMLGIVGASFLAAAVQVLAPEGSAKRVAVFTAGIAIIIAFLSFRGGIDLDSFSEDIASYRYESQEMTEEVNDVNNKLTRSIIEEETSSYILDKGNETGMELSAVDVTARWSDGGYWYPDAAAVSGSFTEEQKSGLSEYMEAELGIPRENQSWNADE